VLHPASGAALTSGAVAPGAGHIFGTDAQGQDVAAQLLAAGRAELPIAFEAALALAASGLLLALAAATNRRDAKAGVALLNLLASLPGLLIGIALIAVAGATSGVVALAVALPFAPGCWRRLLQTARALVDSPFAAAARAMGTSPRRLACQLAASLLAPALAELSLLVARILVAFTLLSFLGFRLPGAASIGALIAQAHAAHAWWLALFPAGALLLACAVLYLLSLGLRALGPQRVDG
jgi:ABC-type dipeptide/oligopeptide/nickel transport system permease subunit